MGTCEEANCSSGNSCEVAMTGTECGAYKCDGMSTTCPSSCTTSADCAQGYACDLGQTKCIATCGSADVQPSPPSCNGLAKNCGPQNADCCTSTLVPCGTYYRSYDGNTYTDKNNPATVSDFRLETFEVTVGRFRKFVDQYIGTAPADGAGAHPLIAASGWQSPGWDSDLPASKTALKSVLKCNPSYQTWTDGASGDETLPINCVNWFEAFAFCIWDGGRLPTEAEWNYAAAGGSEQREYPWGSGVDSSYAVYDCMGDNVSGCTFADTLPVGSKSPKGDGRWGQSDLAGSMWEWTLDWYAGHVNPRNDCANLTTASNRVVRGGSWYDSAANLRAAYRVGGSGHSYNVGFRCARSAP